VLDGDAAEPGSEEAADLVHEHRRAEQARQPLDAEAAASSSAVGGSVAT
jgi:hypothetical protein